MDCNTGSVLRSGWDSLLSNYTRGEGVLLPYQCWNEIETLSELSPAFYSAISSLQPLFRNPPPPEPQPLGPAHPPRIRKRPASNL
eukprot:9473972-Karenia_brevis.AAC.1